MGKIAGSENMFVFFGGKICSIYTAPLESKTNRWLETHNGVISEVALGGSKNYRGNLGRDHKVLLCFGVICMHELLNVGF